MSTSVCAPLFNVWMPFNFGIYMQKKALLGPNDSEDYIVSSFQEWVGKRVRAHDKASWAARVRWAKKKGETPSMSDAPSNAQSIMERLEERRDYAMRWIANRPKRRDKASKAARARWEKSKSAPSSAADQSAVGCAPPHPPVVIPREFNSYITPLPPIGRTSALQSEGVAKPGIFDRGGFGGSGDDENGAHGFSRGRKVARNFIAGLFGDRSDGSKEGAEKLGSFELFREEVLKYWRGQNPGQPECPWIRRDTKALRQFLQGSPNVSFEQFQQYLRNRAASEVNPSELPRRWLADLLEYADGPLDRFKKPLKLSRQW